MPYDSANRSFLTCKISVYRSELLFTAKYAQTVSRYSVNLLQKNVQVESKNIRIAFIQISQSVAFTVYRPVRNIRQRKIHRIVRHKGAHCRNAIDVIYIVYRIDIHLPSPYSELIK